MRNFILLGAALMCFVGANAQTNSYTVTRIVGSGKDPHLINPWGLSRASKAALSENQWWASDEGSGFSTLYDANGTIVNLKVTIPPASGTGTGQPTGTAFDPSTNNFAFATLDGTISLWSSSAFPTTPGTSCAECHVTTAAIKVNHGSSGASYQGLTIATNATSGKLTYYAANANGGVEAYDAETFSPVTLAAGAFTDPEIPTSYSPAGIQAFGKSIVVAYNAIAGGGTGYVDLFDTNGTRKLRFGKGSANSNFNQPWGLAIAPATFGLFSGDLLVGNTGSGWIGAYSLTDGEFKGFLQSPDGYDVAIPGLWGIEFGNGNAESGPTDVLYFTTGGVSYTVGEFGSIKAN